MSAHSPALTFRSNRPRRNSPRESRGPPVGVSTSERYLQAQRLQNQKLMSEGFGCMFLLLLLLCICAKLVATLSVVKMSHVPTEVAASSGW